MKITPLFKKLRKVSIFRYIVNNYRNIVKRDYFCKHSQFVNHGFGRYTKIAKGKNNVIRIGENTRMNGIEFCVVGKGNQIIVGKNCIIGRNCNFWVQGNNSKIIIGDNTTFTQDVHVDVQENNMEVSIGNDCMFSNHIFIRTSDSHPIFDIATNIHINPAKPVKIGSHVWVAPDVRIMKGAIISNGCIIGTSTMVNSHVPENSLAVGTPAKIVKQNK